MANGRSLNAELNAILLAASWEDDEEALPEAALGQREEAILEEARRLAAEGAARGEWITEEWLRKAKNFGRRRRERLWTL